LHFLLELIAALSMLRLQLCGRKVRQDVLLEELKKYNVKAKVAAHKINTDEIAAIRFLSGTSSDFQRGLKIIWGTDKLQHTSITLSMLAAPWLSKHGELPVTQKDNPTWYGILQVSPQKLEYWLRRADGRFAAKAGNPTYSRFSAQAKWTHTAKLQHPSPGGGHTGQRKGPKLAEFHVQDVEGPRLAGLDCAVLPRRPGQGPV
jgi:hypothetical protein